MSAGLDMQLRSANGRIKRLEDACGKRNEEIAALKSRLALLEAVAEAAADRISGAVAMGVNPLYFEEFHVAYAALDQPGAEREK